MPAMGFGPTSLEMRHDRTVTIPRTLLSTVAAALIATVPVALTTRPFGSPSLVVATSPSQLPVFS